VGVGRICKERGLDDFKVPWKNLAVCGLIDKKYGRRQSLLELSE
jgi:hypothetical protein